MTEQERAQLEALTKRVTAFVASLTEQDVADLGAGRKQVTVADVPDRAEAR